MTTNHFIFFIPPGFSSLTTLPMPSIVVIYHRNVGGIIELFMYQGAPEILASLKYGNELNELVMEAAKEHYLEIIQNIFLCNQ